MAMSIDYPIIIQSNESYNTETDTNTTGSSAIQYVDDTPPTTTVNPTINKALWLDRQLFELWRCDDNTPDKNYWVSNKGRVIAPIKIDSSDRFFDGSMIANFNFDNDFTDRCGNYNLTPLGSYEFVSGVFNEAVKVTSSWLDLGAIIENDISVSLFIKNYNSSSNWQTVAISQAGSGYHHLLISTSNVIGFYNGGFYGSDAVLEIGKDYHIVFTKSGTNQKIYVNNVLALDSNSSFENIGDKALRYFGNYSGGTQLCNFGIDQIEIYNRVLTEDEINTIYNEAINYGNFNT